MSRWPYSEPLVIVWKTFESLTKLILILNPSSQAGFRTRVILTPKEEKITEREEA